MGIGKSGTSGGISLPMTLPGCADAARINCSGSACNSLNNQGK